jgi:hypothetical protein
LIAENSSSTLSSEGRVDVIHTTQQKRREKTNRTDEIDID